MYLQEHWIDLPFRGFCTRKKVFDCQQKRQQRCWKGAGSGSGGVVLDSSAKSSIFSAETKLEATDSDPRLQAQVLISTKHSESKGPSLQRFSLPPTIRRKHGASTPVGSALLDGSDSWTPSSRRHLRHGFYYLAGVGAKVAMTSALVPFHIRKTPSSPPAITILPSGVAEAEFTKLVAPS